MNSRLYKIAGSSPLLTWWTGLASPDDDDVSDLSDDAEYLITRLSEDHGFEPVVLM